MQVHVPSTGRYHRAMPGTAISPPRFNDGVDYIRKAFLAVEKVEQRLRRTMAALEGADIPYAIVGGNAVAFWVATRDPEAVRNTRDVDVLIHRGDFERVVEAMEADGFEYHQVNGIDLFIDGPTASPAAGSTCTTPARSSTRATQPASPRSTSGPA